MGFSRQEYWSGLPFPSPGDFPLYRTQVSCIPKSPAFQADALTSEPAGKPIKEISPDYSLEGMNIETAAPIFWLPGANSQLIEKDPDAGKD